MRLELSNCCNSCMGVCVCELTCNQSSVLIWRTFKLIIDFFSGHQDIYGFLFFLSQFWKFIFLENGLACCSLGILDVICDLLLFWKILGCYVLTYLVFPCSLSSSGNYSYVKPFYLVLQLLYSLFYFLTYFFFLCAFVFLLNCLQNLHAKNMLCKDIFLSSIDVRLGRIPYFGNRM